MIDGPVTDAWTRYAGFWGAFLVLAAGWGIMVLGLLAGILWALVRR